MFETAIIIPCMSRYNKTLLKNAKAFGDSIPPRGLKLLLARGRIAAQITGEAPNPAEIGIALRTFSDPSL